MTYVAWQTLDYIKRLPITPIQISPFKETLLGIVGIVVLAMGLILIAGTVLSICKSYRQGQWEINKRGKGNVSFNYGKIVLSVRQGIGYAMVYRRDCRFLQRRSFMVRAQVTPVTLYRFALGVWTSVNPLDFLNRLAIVEVDNDAFRLSHTGSRGHRNFTISPPVVGETYTVELEITESPYVAIGRIYREKELLQEVRSDATDLALPYSSNVFVGVAVWTDRHSDPLSKYEVKDFEIP